MKKLYVIGNGFDIHHDIPSKYSDYKEWLEDNNAELIDDLRNYYNVDDMKWWGQFELELGYPDMADYIDNTAFENEPNYGSDDFRDSDYHRGQIIAENEMGSLINDVKGRFTEWVSSLPSPRGDKKIKLDKDDAFFINFNYTDTLQTLYNVKPEAILFIHGNVGYGTELILGHNRSFDEIDSELTPEIPSPPNNLSDEDMVNWYEEMADNGENYIHQSVRGEVVSQIHRLRKDAEKIIKANRKAFKELKGTESVYIYGLSFSPVDRPYLDEIVRNVDPSTTKWEVSYFSDEDREKAEDFFKQKGIKEDLVSFVKLNDLLLVKQTELKFE